MINRDDIHICDRTKPLPSIAVCTDDVSAENDSEESDDALSGKYMHEWEGPSDGSGPAYEATNPFTRVRGASESCGYGREMADARGIAAVAAATKRGSSLVDDGFARAATDEPRRSTTTPELRTAVPKRLLDAPASRQRSSSLGAHDDPRLQQRPKSLAGSITDLRNGTCI